MADQTPELTQLDHAPATCGEQICTGCGATGVRIWRPYQCWPDKLLCFACACRDQKRDPASVTGDQIGWLAPAVPDGEGSWWGYSSVPQDKVEEWLALPVEPPEEPR
jgi:hypothetical protein